MASVTIIAVPLSIADDDEDDEEDEEEDEEDWVCPAAIESR